MNEKDIFSYLQKLAAKLPSFPDGRINYTNSLEAAVLIIFVECLGEILLLKRSRKVGTYQELWGTPAGYMDEIKPINKKVAEELEEELGLKEKVPIEVKKAYQWTDQNGNKTWLQIPVLVQLDSKPIIKLDWEHTEFRWVLPKQFSEFETVPGLEKTYQHIFS